MEYARMSTAERLCSPLKKISTAVALKSGTWCILNLPQLAWKQSVEAEVGMTSVT
jgi:hypothetical protein